jgi:hypothetical protein
MDRLSDEGFPVERARIVAEGLRIIEQVTGRRGWPQVLLGGVVAGLVAGGIVGWLLGLVVTPDLGLWIAAYGAILGAVAGAIANGLAYWTDGGRRDFSSVRQVDADRYVILVEEDLAERAMSLLGSGPAPAGVASQAGAAPQARAVRPRTGRDTDDEDRSDATPA